MHIYTITSSSLINIKRLGELGTQQQPGLDLNYKHHRMTLKGHRVQMSLHSTSAPSHLPAYQNKKALIIRDWAVVWTRFVTNRMTDWPTNWPLDACLCPTILSESGDKKVGKEFPVCYNMSNHMQATGGYVWRAGHMKLLKWCGRALS